MKLEKEDLVLINRTGENLKSVLRHIVNEFPHSGQSINGMSKHLNYNRSNCQRILDGLNKSKDGKQVLCLLPGVAGLRDFLIKVDALDIEKQLVLEAEKAVDAFELVLKKYARSQAQLKRLLGATVISSDHANGELTAQEKREQHYLVSKQLLGFSINEIFCCYVLRENQQRPDYLQEIAMIAKKGIKRSIAAQPFIQFYTHPHPENFTKPENITAHSTLDSSSFQVGLVQEFTTNGLLEAYSSYSTSNSGIVFNEIPDTPEFDATFLFNNPDELFNPLRAESRCSSTSISIKNPTKKLNMLVFIEKHLDMRSRVNVGCYSGNQKVEEGKLRADDMWTERLPEFPELKVVQPQSLQQISDSEFAINDMTNYVFDLAGLSQEDYSCYMLEVTYPIWSTTYRVYFEHS